MEERKAHGRPSALPVRASHGLCEEGQVWEGSWWPQGMLSVVGVWLRDPGAHARCLLHCPACKSFLGLQSPEMGALLPALPVQTKHLGFEESAGQGAGWGSPLAL